MTATRDDVVAYARDLEGLGADPADPERRAAYLELIAPREVPARAAELGRASGCELVQLGILSAFIRHPLLERPYVTGRAGIDLVKIAGDAHAAYLWRPGLKDELAPGDILIVGGGVDGGGPEHAWMVLDLGDVIHGLDGGQRDRGGDQMIVVREHELAGGYDRAHGASDPGGGSRRRWRWRLDVGAILARFGR